MKPFLNRLFLLRLTALLCGSPLVIQAEEAYSRVVRASPTDGYEDRVLLQHADSDETGAVFVASVVRGPATFAPGITIPAKTTGNFALEPFDVVLSRLGGAGDWVWARRILVPIPFVDGPFNGSIVTTPRTSLEVRDIKVGPTNLFVVGNLRGAGTGVRDVGFVTKLDKSGTVVWTRYLVGRDTSSAAYVSSVAEAPDGSVYLGGRAMGLTLLAWSGTNRLETAQSVDSGSPNVSVGYVVKLSAAGSLLWNTSMTGVDSEGVSGLETDGLGDVFAMINLRGTAVFRNASGGTNPFPNLKFPGKSDRGLFVGKLGGGGSWSRGRIYGDGAELGVIPGGINSLQSVRGSDLKLIAGKVFVAGAFTAQGFDKDQGFIARLTAENLASEGSVAYLMAGGQGAANPTRIRSSGSGLFVVGRRPITLRVYGDVSPTATELGEIDKEMVSLEPGWFVGSFDLNLKPEWLGTTARPEFLTSPRDFEGNLLAYDGANRRVYWGGSFSTEADSRKLVLGEYPFEASLTTPRGTAVGERVFGWGWLTGFDAGGKPMQQVLLSIASRIPGFRINGVTIPTNSYSQGFLEGAAINIRADNMEANGTRHVFEGFALDNVPGTTQARSLGITLTSDTTVTLNWRTEHRLEIQSDHAFVGLDVAALAGNPEPIYGTTWVRDGDPVDVTVDAIIPYTDTSRPGTRIILSKYTLTDLAAPVAIGEVSGRVQVTPLKAVGFGMRKPMNLRYFWQRQHKVSVQASNPDAGSMLLTRQTPVTTTSPTLSGPGELWFNAGATVQILARGTNDAATLTLKGWDYAAPVPLYFPTTTFLPNDPNTEIEKQLTSSGYLSRTQLTTGGPVHYVRTISNLGQGLSILWSYGDPSYSTNVAVGVPFTFPNISGKGTPPTTGWSGVRVLDGPPGSTGDDMLIWDPRNKWAIPTRPGVFLLDLDYGTAPNTKRVVLQVYTGFSGDRMQNDPTGLRRYSNPQGYQRHIAKTPPVVLDRLEKDRFWFKAFRYSSGDATVKNGRFEASTGKSVLVYTELPSTASPNAVPTGDTTTEDTKVVVVETLGWASAPQLAEGPPATIGTALSSPQYDKAKLGTGYVMFENANYNPDIYERSVPSGPIIPINSVPTDSLIDIPFQRRLVVTWYDEALGAHWPATPVYYLRFVWPTNNRIVIASRLGSEGLNTSGQRQMEFNPELYENVRIYHQPDPEKPGYNPNEEHARIHPSLYAALSGRAVPAAFALRNDLNISSNLIASSGGRFAATNYTSDPYVLVQYVEKATGLPRMAVYSVAREDTTTRDPWVAELPGANGDTYRFSYNVLAGERLQAPYPLNLALGVQPCINTVPNPGSSPANAPNGTYFLDVPNQPRAWFIDHKGGTWAAAGNSFIESYFVYPLAEDFWYPFGQDHASIAVSKVGDCIPWLPAFALPGQQGVFDPDAADFRTRDVPAKVLHATAWPANPPVLKVGETLSYAGGEYKADNPDAPGLPGVIGFAAAEVVFDSKNPFKQTLASSSVNYQNSYSARIIAPLEERRIAVPLSALPAALNNPASPDITVDGDSWFFNKLPPSLQKRVFYKPLAKLTASSAPGVLVLRGFVNDKTLGAGDLTAAPPPVYVLEPNVLTTSDTAALAKGYETLNSWTSVVTDLFNLSRNPAGVAGGGWNVGLERIANSPSNVKPMTALGPGLALVPNPQLLDPTFASGGVGYVTVAENNHESLGDAPVTLHVIKIDPAQRYRGAIKTILPVNVFDEKITLRHTADFGGNVDQVVYSWWYREEDGRVKVGDIPPGIPGVTPIWQPFDASTVAGRVEIHLDGNPTLLLADNLIFTRYRFNTPTFSDSAWSQWAGSANSSTRDLDNDGRPDLQAQLAMGWVKRVLDGVNPYEARIREFGKNSSPSTVSSMIRQLGAPFVGPVALHASKDVIENLGLIELYETVLARARAMTVDGSSGTVTSGINAAILLASTRLAEFYTLLANEAWDDALDPTIGFGNGNLAHDSLNAARFSFENQQPNLLSEELALLRGVDESFGRPVFNRLFWNFTKGEGEVAYALNYQIADVNQDGFIDENDALKQYPMGHGDAWGHYLSAMRKRYDLLRTPLFVWENRSEYYNLLDVSLGVDFFDERHFARTAAARARVGAEIVNLTFRSRFSEAGDSKLSGYTDPDKDRAWGVTEWARRAGQAAYFDWVTANAILPHADPDPSHEGINRIDRQSIREIGEIATQLAGVQGVLDGADSGMNAIGLDPDVMAFDIDPTHLDIGSTAQVGTKAVQGLTHFEQIYERALEAMRNANTAFQYANEQKARTRAIEQSAEDLRREAIDKDLEYRNGLIAIFGTPYEGQIGPGRAYPAGYAGPDLNLFMYVDVNAITPDTVPVANAEAYYDEYVSFHDLAQDIPEEFKADIEEHFLDDISVEINTAVELLGDDLVHLKLPATAGDYTFVAPDSWGQRAAPGRLQLLVGEMLQVQADLSLAVGDYDYLIKQLRDRVSLIQMRADIHAETLGIREAAYDRTLGLNAAIVGLQGVGIAAQRTADWLEIIQEAASTLPLAVGTSTDATAPARQAIKFAASGGWLASAIIAGASEGAVNLLDSSKELFDLRDGIDIDKKEMSVELRGMLHEIEELLVNEGVTRIRLFSIREQLRGLLDQYRATLQEGIRLIEERKNANIRLATATQNNRYHDMLFRSSRHEATLRYRSLYDLAQRYCYLAAKAYDYETNFDPRDRASAQPLMAEIVRARSLGRLAENQPVAGKGLAGVMARLQDNFRAVEGRLGFNNLQLDTTTFSLRREMAGIPVSAQSDDAWANYLEAAKVPNLWNLPEFRRNCRPFLAPGGDQPGIVLRFQSEVIAGNNFFGRMLGAGDSAYDPTLYATKIRGVGIRLKGYPVERLARTPYVYLIPAGLDVMTVPNSPTLAKREWNVMDQAIPVPHAVGTLDLARQSWLPTLDSLSGTMGETRRFSSFRAGVLDGDPDVNVTRLVGRSVWNDKWLLILPGQLMHRIPEIGMEEFIANVKDIELTFETYGYSGN